MQAPADPDPAAASAPADPGPAAAFAPADPGPAAAFAPDPRNQRKVAQGSWTLYDFANTIFSYAIVSTAIGLWLTSDDRFGPGLGQLVQGITIAVSVGLNALVSPILGALSDRNGRRLPFLFLFTVLTIVPSAIIGPTPAVVGAILFTIANFAYQAALIYYDATLTMVSRPETRGRLSGIGVGVGYMGTIFAAVTLILLGITDSPDPIFFVAGVLFAVFAIPIFLVVRDRPRPDARPVTVADALGSLTQLRVTIAHARLVPGLPRFLVNMEGPALAQNRGLRGPLERSA